MIPNAQTWKLSVGFRERKYSCKNVPASLLTLNLTENLLKELKLKVYRKGPGNLQDLKAVCVDD